MAKIRKIYDETIKPNGEKTVIYPITSTRAVYTPTSVTIDSLLNEGYRFGGIVLPTDSPSITDQRVFYGASVPGNYANFGGINVDGGEAIFFMWDGTTWHKGIFGGAGSNNLTGFKSLASIIDLPNEPTMYGYLIDDYMYVWVGENGDTLSGTYQNVGQLRGASAYEVAVRNGYEGTEQQWLADPVNGIKGVSVTSVTEVGPHSDANSAENTYRITLSNNEKLDMKVKNGKGINSVTVVGNYSSLDGATNTYRISLSDNTVFEFQVINGSQGNTGSSIDYPFELLNVLNSTATDKGVTALKIKELNEDVTHIGTALNSTDTNIKHIIDFEGTQINPVTHERAVLDTEGTNLETKMLRQSNELFGLTSGLDVSKSEAIIVKTNMNATKKWIGTDNKWYQSNTTNTGYYCSIKAGTLISATGNSTHAGRLALVNSIDGVGDDVSYAQGGYVDIAIGGAITLQVNQDCILWVWNLYDTSTATFPSTLKFITYQSDIEEAVKEIKSAVNPEASTQTKTRNDLTSTKMFISTSGPWTQSSMSYAGKYTHVAKGQKLTITARDDRNTRYALVTAIGAANEMPSFAQGGSEVLFAGMTATVYVEQDCILWVYNNTDSSTVVFPQLLSISTYSIDGTIAGGGSTITRYAVNLCDENKVTRGVLDSAGDVGTGTSLVTDYIKIALDNTKKTQYLHCCSSVFRTSAFAYGAQSVCTYDSTKQFIGKIDDVAAAIDKESESNVDIFESAYYVRVQFASGHDHLYVANNNFTKVPVYSVYNPADLNPTTEYNVDKIRNSDGAITEMLETALDYANNGSVTNLGYGDSNTAFDATVEAVTPDPWNSDRYTGEKKQINCSGFVQLCLQGIRYRNSRYVTGTDGVNLGNLYRFDSKSEQNYHNNAAAAGGRTILCSNYEKFYASRLCSYAYDRGFLYLIEDGFKNVEVGDVIFVSSDSSSFYGIEHVVWVSAVFPKKDGTKSIRVMQVSGSSATNLAHESSYTTRDADWCYAARFPLPDIAMCKEDIVQSVSASTISSLPAEGSGTLATVNLTENLHAKGVYTVAVKTNTIPEGAEVVVKSGSTILGGSGEALFIRSDNVTVKHFHLLADSSISANTLTIALVAHEAVSTQVSVQSVNVYKGYITV